jgi:hypothetical protein
LPEPSVDGHDGDGDREEKWHIQGEVCLQKSFGKDLTDIAPECSVGQWKSGEMGLKKKHLQYRDVC